MRFIGHFDTCQYGKHGTGGHEQTTSRLIWKTRIFQDYSRKHDSDLTMETEHINMEYLKRRAGRTKVESIERAWGDN